MINFKINNNDEALNTIGIHFQKKPYPGGEKYEFHIDNNDLLIIGELESLADTRYINPNFCSILKSKNDNSYNPIEYALSALAIKKWDIKWVINNIEEVYVDNDQLKITGVASAYVTDFKKTL